MIRKALEQDTTEIRELWKECFPKDDPRYVEFYFKTYYKPEDTFVALEDGKIQAALIRTRHDLMFNGRVLQASMIKAIPGVSGERRSKSMDELMDIVLDACSHSELVTLADADQADLYESFGFRRIYRRCEYTLQRSDVKRITNFGCAYEPTPIDLLKVYSNYIKRFNGFYARDLAYFVAFKKQITSTGGKIVAYYNGRNQIQGYAVMRPEGNELIGDEIVYLDSMSLFKLCNACLQEKRIIKLRVSEAENLSKLFPEARVRYYDSTMARINEKDLFMRLFSRRIATVEDAFAISRRPLNLNENR